MTINDRQARTLTAFIACTAIFSASMATAQDYQDYVPPERIARGETWAGKSIVQILDCTLNGSLRAKAKLTRLKAARWSDICSSALENDKTYATYGCHSPGSVPRSAYFCQAVKVSNGTMRRNPEFWEIVDALYDQKPPAVQRDSPKPDRPTRVIGI